MGATAWYYFVPYQSDIHAALEALRLDVFQRGDYEKTMDEEDGETPETMDELLEWSEDAGTHSIIDIMSGISYQPEAFKASPLSPADLLTAFNTTQPEHDLVEQLLSDYTLIDKIQIPRWEARYFVIYRNQQPAELCFIGASGD